MPSWLPSLASFSCLCLRLPQRSSKGSWMKWCEHFFFPSPSPTQTQTLVLLYTLHSLSKVRLQRMASNRDKVHLPMEDSRDGKEGGSRDGGGPHSSPVRGPRHDAPKSGRGPIILRGAHHSLLPPHRHHHSSFHSYIALIPRIPRSTVEDTRRSRLSTALSPYLSLSFPNLSLFPSPSSLFIYLVASLSTS
jgi:hypothetical protein